MRILLVTRGLPASGKSTWVRENNLSNFTLNPDMLRVLAQSPLLNLDHSFSISPKNDPMIWDFFYKILETRMKNGDFTVIDATSINPMNLHTYQKLCHEYAYKLYIIDFTDVDLEICKQRNEDRRANGGIFVPVEIINKMFKQLECSALSKSFNLLKPKQWRECLIAPKDLNSYEKIIHIGDIQGCYSVLENIGKINPNYFYVFLGDYIDRGIENDLVLKYLLEICNLPNVWLLEGNHERHLRTFARGLESSSKEFKDFTLPQIKESGLTQQDIARLCLKFKSCLLYSFRDKIIFCTHAGIPYLPSKLEEISFIPSSAMINGIGGYDDVSLVAKIFEENSPNNIYQIFGHRNRENLPIRVSKRVFVGEGKVEFGGYLRVISLDNGGFETFEFKNDIYKFETQKELTEMEQLVEQLRKNSYVKERQFGDISSFNFTKKAFSQKVWNDLICKARGLFIDTKEMNIVARSYEKFFNLDEMESLSLENLKNTLQFPVRVFVKENGFLGIVSYYQQQLIITTKGDMQGDYAQLFKKLIGELELEKRLIECLEQHPNISLVFEVIEPTLDPHIIEYKNRQIVLLDAIYNSIEFSKMPYEVLEQIAKSLGVRVKEYYAILKTPKELEEFIAKESERNDKHLEGFVFEDSKLFMFKFKLPFYRYWKYMRSLVMSYASKIKALLAKEDYINIEKVLESIPLEYPFLIWWSQSVRNLLVSKDKERLEELLNSSLIHLRNLFFETQNFK